MTLSQHTYIQKLLNLILLNKATIMKPKGGHVYMASPSAEEFEKLIDLLKAVIKRDHLPFFLRLEQGRACPSHHTESVARFKAR